MATNEILQFAETDTGTNLLTQVDYAADAQRLVGNQPGIARQQLVNKVLRQTSLVSAAIAKFIADNQSNNVVDSATPTNLASWFSLALGSIASLPTAVAGGTANALTADFTTDVGLSDGKTIIVRAASANTTSTPTLSTDGTTALTIVKGSNGALVAGDIAGAGHWLELQYDTTLTKWVLLNPATGITPPIAGGIPQNSQSASYTMVLADAGKHIFHPSADTTARTWFIPANVSVAFPIGTALTYVNQNAAGVITLAINTDTMRLAGSGATGSRSLAANGVATALKVTATEWIISGTGLT